LILPLAGTNFSRLQHKKEQRNSYLDREKSLKFTDKYKRLRQLVWRPCTKKKEYRFEREIKTENYTGLIYQVLVSVHELTQQLLLFCFFPLFYQKGRSPASSGTKTT